MAGLIGGFGRSEGEAVLTRTERARLWLREPIHRGVVAVVTLAALLRLVGIGHDLPNVYYPDEQHVVNRTLSLGSLDLNPHWFHKPAGLLYLLAGEYGLAYSVGRLAGRMGSVQDFAVGYFVDPSLFFWIGRLTVCVFGIATIALLYRMGRRFHSREIGLLGAILLAVTASHVLSSQEVKEDVPCALLTLASTFFLIRAGERGRARDLCLAGALGGLAVATKYYAFYLLPLSVVAAFLGRFVVSEDGRAAQRPGLRGDLQAFAGCIGFALVFQAVFFLCSPFNFLDPQWYAIDFRPPVARVADRLSVPWLVKPFDLYFRARVSWRSVGTTVLLLAGAASAFVALGRLYRSRGRTLFLVGIPLVFAGLLAFLSIRSERFRVSADWWRWVMFGSSGMGPALATVALAGLVASAIRRSVADLVVLASVAAFMVLASLYDQPQRIEPRHLTVLYPLFALSAAALLADLGRLARRAMPAPLARAVPLLLLAGLAVDPAIFLARHVQRNLRDDTRTLAKNWFEANVEAGSRVLNDKEYVKIRPTRRNFEHLLERLHRETKPNEPFTKGKDVYYAYQMLASDLYPGPTYDVTVLDPPWWLYSEADLGKGHDPGMGNPLAVRLPESLDSYRLDGYRYVITASKSYRQYTRGEFRKNFPTWARFYDELSELEPIHVETEDPGRNGPEVRIYRL